LQQELFFGEVQIHGASLPGAPHCNKVDAKPFAVDFELQDWAFRAQHAAPLP